ncbi:hypothetical protein ASPCADRAFT_164267 [Aspergillus carbonarius ITEM 5010]|uniref:Uncharacterized protein n=1 Tax=Aspergillus carbonarius (strain ITEM 5010) TaxID=602072 RepID=A0A1R3RUB3_ASPC5|nr:hypothetical protein ASPCADRAFT_164267 [Aspergillus carbonarius ITEM 5010]
MSHSTPRPVPAAHHLIYLLLLLPTGLSIALLLSDSRHWTLTGDLYTLINTYRTSVQTALQILATVLGTIQLVTICRLINNATRIRFTRPTHHTTLNHLALWSALSTPTTNFSLPLPQILLTFLLANFSAILSALWTGALTPTATTTTTNTTIHIPSYTNRTFIKEYPSQIDNTGPSLRTSHGYFTYSVGVGLLTSLISSASSASPLTGTLRNRTHPKLDSTGFTYTGRSYGVGAPVGLTDASIALYPWAANYTYRERGYDAQLTCVYNTSSLFLLQDTYYNALYDARGPLPDSNSSSGEYSVYTGWSTDTIVALGVASDPIAYTKSRYVAAAAGRSYLALNASQCLVTFIPTWFQVDVTIQNKQIYVSRINSSFFSPFLTSSEEQEMDIDPTNRTIHVVMRQLELISNDLTSFYRSTLGDAFNTSIADFTTSSNSTSTNTTTTSLTGIKNTYISLLDDILESYAAAQLIIGNFTTPTTATLTIEALRLGSRVYIIAVFVVSLIVVGLVGVEATRTSAWRDLPGFDFLDGRMLVLGAANGGRSIAERAAERGWRGKDMGGDWSAVGGGGEGRVEVSLGGGRDADDDDDDDDDRGEVIRTRE